MTQTNGNEVLESAKDSIKCELDDTVKEMLSENPDCDFEFIRDNIDYDGRLTEIVDSSVPIYNHDIMACASIPEIWSREPELGPAFDGTPTLINTTAGLIYEYLMEYAWEILEKIVSENID